MKQEEFFFFKKCHKLFLETPALNLGLFRRFFGADFSGATSVFVLISTGCFLTVLPDLEYKKKLAEQTKSCFTEKQIHEKGVLVCYNQFLILVLKSGRKNHSECFPHVCHGLFCLKMHSLVVLNRYLLMEKLSDVGSGWMRARSASQQGGGLHKCSYQANKERGRGENMRYDAAC